MAHTNGIHGQKASLTNYVAYKLPDSPNIERIGHLDLQQNIIQPLAFASGTALSSLYQVIDAGLSNIRPCGSSITLASVQLLPPISGRDILCVGKNYSEHAKEFNASGFDSSDKVDQPTHPVIFTKRFTSIIADGEEIYPHPKFTDTLDYEGELGVVIGKDGFRVQQDDAMDYVWGYTIINDMTARERQRDHKQFYIGKSPDTFCPMGPIAVPKEELPKTLRVQTRVNGELRQNATTEDLIFSIPFLVKTLSEGQTICRGDVLATGTPAGVGIGRKPPVYLQPGDTVEVSIDGLGKLMNRIASTDSENYTMQRLQSIAPLADKTTMRTLDTSRLTNVNGKLLNCRHIGNKTGPAAVFIHGLGGSIDSWTPLISQLKLVESYDLYLYDFEGQGLSITLPLSVVTVKSLANDLYNLLRQQAASVGPFTILAHSMGSLIAGEFAISHPDMIEKLVLLGPPIQPLPDAASEGSRLRAVTVRRGGMDGVVDAVVAAGTSASTKAKNPIAISAIRLSLLSQDPEGYAKACSALAGTHIEAVDFDKIDAKLLVITGSEDKVSPPDWCRKLVEGKEKRRSVVLPDVGHWHVFEDVKGVSDVVRQVLT